MEPSEDPPTEITEEQTPAEPPPKSPSAERQVSIGVNRWQKISWARREGVDREAETQCNLAEILGCGSFLALRGCSGFSVKPG
jgi:hypothetical protein